MTPRQKRNLTLAKQRRIEKAIAAYMAVHVERATMIEAAVNSLLASGYRHEWLGQSPRGVTVQ